MRFENFRFGIDYTKEKNLMSKYYKVMKPRRGKKEDIPFCDTTLVLIPIYSNNPEQNEKARNGKPETRKMS